MLLMLKIDLYTRPTPGSVFDAIERGILLSDTEKLRNSRASILPNSKLLEEPLAVFPRKSRELGQIRSLSIESRRHLNPTHYCCSYVKAIQQIFGTLPRLFMCANDTYVFSFLVEYVEAAHRKER